MNPGKLRRRRRASSSTRRTSAQSAAATLPNSKRTAQGSRHEAPKRWGGSRGQGLGIRARRAEHRPGALVPLADVTADTLRPLIWAHIDRKADDPYRRFQRSQPPHAGRFAPPVLNPLCFRGVAYVRPLQVVDDQAQEGRRRRQARQDLHQADPRDRDRGPDRRRRPRRQPAPAPRGRQGARREHAQGQDRARDQEGHRRRRGRGLRGGGLRGLRPGRHRDLRRGADRQQEPHRRRGAPRPHQARRQPRRERLRRVPVREEGRCRRSTPRRSTSTR